MTGSPTTPILTLTSMALHLPLPYPILANSASEQQQVSSSLSSFVNEWNTPRRRQRRRRRRRPGNTKRNNLGKLDDDKTAASTTVKRRMNTNCIHKWHLHIEHENVCTNDMNYPIEWTDSTEICQHMFHETAQKCCDRFYAGRECVIYDDDDRGGGRDGAIEAGAGTGTEATTGTGGVTSSAAVGATINNDMISSSSSKKPTQQPTKAPTSTYFIDHFSGMCHDAAIVHQPHYITTTYGRYESCCNASFAKAKCLADKLLLDDDNDTTPPLKPTQQLTNAPISTYFIDHFSGMCHNAAIVDQPYYITTTYRRYESCCNASFARAKCLADKPLLDDDNDTTPPPVRMKDRRKPSKKPTPKPTPAPKSTYFIDHFSGLCQDTTHVDQPHYITTTYRRYKSCCNASFAKAKCLAAEPLPDDNKNPTPAPVPITPGPTYLPTQITYYVELFTGMCVDTIDVPMPHHVASNTTKQFSNYRDCCKTSFRKEECFAEGPATTEPTSSPTEDATTNPSYLPSSLPSGRPSSVPSGLPSSLPSGQPSLHTARPTGGECTEDKWRYDVEYVDGCTNTLAINDDGGSASTSGGGSSNGILLFQSWQECCHRFFSRRRNCRVDDRCRTDVEVVSYVDRRSRTISNDDCESHPMYHPDDVNKDGCTNSLDFPESWINLGENRGTAFFYPTVHECCEELYLKKGYDCNVRNVCAVFSTDHPTSSPTLLLPQPQKENSDKLTVDITSCLEQPWHPDMASATNGVIGGCSNDAGYPESWNESPGMLVFDTAEECCNTHLIPYGLECEIRDTCPVNTSIDPRPSNAGSPDNNDDDPPSYSSFSSSCESAKWHPTEDLTKCTNDFDYPQNWEDLMFDDATECCTNVFNYADCETEDVCASSNVLTSGPSLMPSQEPSVIPTKMPSPKPSTAMPTSEPPTKMPTSAPVHESSPPTNPCSGKKKRKCWAPLCIWDKSQNSCLLVADQQTPSTKPTSPPTGEGTIRSRCTGKSKRRCPEVPGCAWNTSINSCADNGDGCEGRMYHPRSAIDRTCSNDRDYPEIWDRPGMVAKYLLASADQCCASFYGDGPCNVVDVCPTTG